MRVAAGPPNAVADAQKDTVSYRRSRDLWLVLMIMVAVVALAAALASTGMMWLSVGTLTGLLLSSSV